MAPTIPAEADLLPEMAGKLLDRVRRSRARIHAITNVVAQTFTANLILAAGGVPSMTTAPTEVEAFTDRAAALLVNLGTLDDERRAAILLAVARARRSDLPWVLDPVFVDASPMRVEFAASLVRSAPSVVRCNAAEFAALVGRPASAKAASDFAERHTTVVALTGPEDVITDGRRTITIRNGHALMGRITAMGCAGTALVAAFSALEPDRLVAAAAALLVLGVAGEIAAARCNGPGSFPAAFLDALDGLGGGDIAFRARLS